jgi:hypothetical protein
MTEHDLASFLKHHDALFPGIRDWWRKGEPEAIRTRANAWLKRLAPHTLDEAKRASSALFESREKPPYFGQQLDWVCNYLLPRPLLNDAPAPHLSRCQLCGGNGILTAIFQEPQQTPNGNPLQDNTGTVACKCSKGQWINERRQASKDGTPLQTWDASRMQIARVICSDDLAERLVDMQKRRPGLAAAVQRVSDTLRGVRG